MEENHQNLSTYFRGFAKIDLHHLPSGAYSEKRVKGYLNIFQIEGYSREDPVHTIAASIKEDSLSKALSRRNIDANSLYDSRNFPHVPLESEEFLQCLQGQDLLEAARRSPGVRWWTVRLYSAEIPRSLQLYLRDTYSLTFPSRDYELLQLLWFQETPDFEQWEQNLGKSNFSYVRRAYSSPGLNKAIKALLPFMSLWDSFQLRQLGYVVSTHSDEEMTHYLQEIYKIWSAFPPNKIDLRSVKLVEGMMPSYSLEDQQKIESWMSEGILFPGIKEDGDRDRLQAGLLAIEGRILSLGLFFLDASCLQEASVFLRRKLGVGRKSTLRQAFFRCWKPYLDEGNLIFQVSEKEYEEKPTSHESLEDRAYEATISSMLQVWMVCFRYFIGPRRGKGEEEPSGKSILDLEGRQMMLKTAERLGFDMPGKDKPKGPRIQTFQFVSKQLLSDAEFVDPKKTKFLAEKFGQLYSTTPSQRKQAIPPLTTDHEALKASFRAGRPEIQEYDSIRPIFFIGSVYSSGQPAKLFPTAFAVMREIFFSFFGRSHHKEIEVISSSPVQLDPHPPGTPSPSTPDELGGESTDETTQEDERDKISDSHTSVENRPQSPSGPAVPTGAMHGIEPTAPLAAGFEDEISIGSLNQRCEITVHRSATEILSTWCLNGNPELIVFFLFDSRAYYKFLVTEQLHMRQTINTLSSDHYFLVIDQNTARTADREDLLNEAITRRLILVGLNDGAQVDKTKSPLDENGRISLLDLKEYLEKYDVVTGKRKAIENHSDDPEPVNKKRQR